MTAPTNVEELNDAMQEAERPRRGIGNLRGQLGVLAAIAAIGGAVTPTAQRDGVPASRDDREKRNAEKLSRREFKTARAEAKRQRKAARRLAPKSAVPETETPVSVSPASL